MDLSSWREFRKMDGQRSPCHMYKSLGVPFPRRALSRNAFARYKRATTALLDDILRLAEQNLPLGLGANAARAGIDFLGFSVSAHCSRAHPDRLFPALEVWKVIHVLALPL